LCKPIAPTVCVQVELKVTPTHPVLQAFVNTTMTVRTMKLAIASIAYVGQCAMTKLVRRLPNVLGNNTNLLALADQAPAVIHTYRAHHIATNNRNLNAWPTLIVRQNWLASIADAPTHANRPIFVHVIKLAWLSIRTRYEQSCAAVLQTLPSTVMVNVALSLCKKSAVPTMNVPTLINACEVYVY
jgi:hypothetical protein